MYSQSASTTVLHTVAGHQYESTYSIRTVVGFSGEALITVEASHYDTDLKRVVARTTICTTPNSSVAFEEYKNAIANKLWGNI